MTEAGLCAKDQANRAHEQEWLAIFPFLMRFIQLSFLQSSHCLARPAAHTDGASDATFASVIS